MKKKNLKIITKPILKKLIRNDKTVQSWIPNKSNVERWKHEKKLITQKDRRK